MDGEVIGKKTARADQLHTKGFRTLELIDKNTPDYYSARRWLTVPFSSNQWFNQCTQESPGGEIGRHASFRC